MGVVYRARQIELGRPVALKVLSPQLAGDPEFAERFNREARALAALSHPNIVQVYEFGREGELYYLVMELVEGTSLRDVIRAGRAAPEAALRLVPQICDALEYAHAEGVVHRDIKPENILVDARGRVKIADFGLAKMAKARALTQTNVIMGTPAYMAPEQVESVRGVDHRADIYSLGVVIYELLTGELPIGAFDPPSRKGAEPRFDPVVMKALAKEPERRYQRASEVKTELARPAPSRAAKGGRPLLAGALIAGIALVAVALDFFPGPRLVPQSAVAWFAMACAAGTVVPIAIALFRRRFAIAAACAALGAAAFLGGWALQGRTSSFERATRQMMEARALQLFEAAIDKPPFGPGQAELEKELHPDMGAYFRRRYQEEPGQEARLMALRLCLKSGGPEAPRLLAERLAADTPEERFLLEFLLGSATNQFGETPIDELMVVPGLIDAAVKLTVSADASTRRRGAGVLGRQRDARSREILQRMAQWDPDDGVRWEAVVGLSRIGDAGSLNFLRSLPKDKALDDAIQRLERRLR
jgi:hypothetical protein